MLTQQRLEWPPGTEVRLIRDDGDNSPRAVVVEDPGAEFYIHLDKVAKVSKEVSEGRVTMGYLRQHHRKVYEAAVHRIDGGPSNFENMPKAKRLEDSCEVIDAFPWDGETGFWSKISKGDFTAAAEKRPSLFEDRPKTPLEKAGFKVGEMVELKEQWCGEPKGSKVKIVKDDGDEEPRVRPADGGEFYIYLRALSKLDQNNSMLDRDIDGMGVDNGEEVALQIKETAAPVPLTYHQNEAQKKEALAIGENVFRKRFTPG